MQCHCCCHFPRASSAGNIGWNEMEQRNSGNLFRSIFRWNCFQTFYLMRRTSHSMRKLNISIAIAIIEWCTAWRLYAFRYTIPIGSNHTVIDHSWTGSSERQFMYRKTIHSFLSDYLNLVAKPLPDHRCVASRTIRFDWRRNLNNWQWQLQFALFGNKRTRHSRQSGVTFPQIPSPHHILADVNREWKYKRSVCKREFQKTIGNQIVSSYIFWTFVKLKTIENVVPDEVIQLWFLARFSDRISCCKSCRFRVS